MFWGSLGWVFLSFGNFFVCVFCLGFFVYSLEFVVVVCFLFLNDESLLSVEQLLKQWIIAVVCFCGI